MPLQLHTDVKACGDAPGVEGVVAYGTEGCGEGKAKGRAGPDVRLPGFGAIAKIGCRTRIWRAKHRTTRTSLVVIRVAIHLVKRPVEREWRTTVWGGIPPDFVRNVAQLIHRQAAGV
ncbi:hypothetical protein AURDEDRAFT_127844 [Auricularia subglabra TFB-10046 SS5]|uniref:Uncharacterized protein n=1 Tax=Auricularia subglabra (strain TFB-10046 / SS5) TaxID=717982 RepID=J0WY11_AURST|nr:hypothetical protein AURDEDRAFT_127844 [Auricularia subglabra TFB-10046 SS5]